MISNTTSVPYSFLFILLLSPPPPRSSFLFFLTMTLVGFALAFYTLFRQDRDAPDFSSLGHSMASMFAYLLVRHSFQSVFL